MRPSSLAAILMALALPAAALAGPDGVYHVKGVNPDDGRDYTGTVKISRKDDVYRVVWKIGETQTVGMGIGLRLVDGQMVAGPASDADIGISVAYASGETFGNATYTQFTDGTWRGVWAFKGDRAVSTEEWVPTVRQIQVKADPAARPKTKTSRSEMSEVEQATIADGKVERAPSRLISSPLPASASPKS